MDELEQDTMMVLLLFCCIAKWRDSQKRKKRRPRRYSVRPLNRARQSLGHFYTLVPFTKMHDHEQFFKYTRMTPSLYDHLLALVGPHLKKNESKNPLSPSHQLTMTLHYLSEGCSMQQIAWDYYVGKTTVHKVIKETCKVLWEILMPIYIPAPTQEQFEEIERGFYKRWNVPNCIGALDGKHCMLQAPPHTGTEYFSYKKQFSLVLMAACDVFYRFVFVDIGTPGSQHDSSTFRHSGFGTALLNGELPIPAAKPLPGTDTPFRFFMVADSAFPLQFMQQLTTNN